MLSPLMFITNDNFYQGDHLEQARRALSGGITLLQYRTKVATIDNMIKVATQILMLAKEFGAKVIMNDHLTLALNIQCDGVHLGYDDVQECAFSVDTPRPSILGLTVNNDMQAQWVKSFRPTYVGLGPYKFTATKQKLASVLTKTQIENFIQKLKPIPTFLIGGIELDDIKDCLDLGAYGVAISGALCRDEKIELKAKEALNLVTESYEN